MRHQSHSFEICHLPHYYAFATFSIWLHSLCNTEQDSMEILSHIVVSGILVTNNLRPLLVISVISAMSETK